MFAALQSAVGYQPPSPTIENGACNDDGVTTPKAKQSSGRTSNRPPVDVVDTAKKASRSLLPSPDDTISPLPGDESTVPSSSPPTDNGKPIAQNLRDIINKENISAPPLVSDPTRPTKGRSNVTYQTATSTTKPPIRGRASGKSKKKKSKKFTLPFLLGYEQMVRGQDNADASTTTHLRPAFDKLRYIGGDSDKNPASVGMADGNDSAASLLDDDRSTGTSGTLDTYGTADRSDADKESDAISYLTSMSNRICMDDGTILTFAAIVQSLDVLTRKEDEMTCDNNLILLLQSISDAVLSASASSDDEIDAELEHDGLTFAEFVHAYQNVAMSIRAMRRFPAEGEDRKARTRDRAQQLLLSFVPNEIALKDEDMVDVELDEQKDSEGGENEMGAKETEQAENQVTVAELEQTIAKLEAEIEEADNKAKKQQGEMQKSLNNKILSLEAEKGELEKQIDKTKASLEEAQTKREVMMEDQKQLLKTVSTMKAEVVSLENLISNIANEKKTHLAMAQQEMEQTKATLSGTILALEEEKKILLDKIKARDKSNIDKVKFKTKMALVVCGAIALSAAAAGGVSFTMRNEMTTDVVEEYPTGIDVDEAIPYPTSQVSPRSTQHFALRHKIRQIEADHTQWKQVAREEIERKQFYELMNAPVVSTSETIEIIPASKISKRFGIIRSQARMHILSAMGGATLTTLVSKVLFDGSVKVVSSATSSPLASVVGALRGASMSSLASRVMVEGTAKVAASTTARSFAMTRVIGAAIGSPFALVMSVGMVAIVITSVHAAGNDDGESIDV